MIRKYKRVSNNHSTWLGVSTVPKNRGFNKQDLEKAGIVMNGNGLALSPEVQMQMM